MRHCRKLLATPLKVAGVFLREKYRMIERVTRSIVELLYTVTWSDMESTLSFAGCCIKCWLTERSQRMLHLC